MLYLKETILTSLITNKLQFLHTASLFCVLCASVKSQEDRTVRFWEKKNQNFKSLSSNKRWGFQNQKTHWSPWGLFYKVLNSIAVTVIQRRENSFDEALTNLKD